MDWVDDVVRFWFHELRPMDWWRGAPSVDERVRARFGALREGLVRDPPDVLSLDARGHLATVVAFDQFGRHLFRGSSRAFDADGLALATTLHAIDRRLDAELDGPQRQFLFMPLMHSEDIALQRRSLALYATLPDPHALDAARDHHATIERFGRFPARNAALGRTSTEAERAFLAERRQKEG